jgi:hypothetical protein
VILGHQGVDVTKRIFDHCPCVLDERKRARARAEDEYLTLEEPLPPRGVICIAVEVRSVHDILR